MLVRFNKGPWHRKVRDMDPHEVSKGRFHVAISSPGSIADYTRNDLFTTTVFNHKIAVYTIKMVVVDLGSGPRQVPSVYPDGAICFEHVGTR